MLCCISPSHSVPHHFTIVPITHWHITGKADQRPRKHGEHGGGKVVSTQCIPMLNLQASSWQLQFIIMLPISIHSRFLIQLHDPRLASKISRSPPNVCNSSRTRMQCCRLGNYFAPFSRISHFRSFHFMVLACGMLFPIACILLPFISYHAHH